MMPGFPRHCICVSLHLQLPGFAVAGIHALMIVKKKNIDFHVTSFRIAAIFACVAAILQPISGDHSARDVAHRQPAKLAAMEGVFKTGTHVPLLIGGIPDPKTQEVKYGMEIPGLLSFMMGGNTNTEIKGLDQLGCGRSTAGSDYAYRVPAHGRAGHVYVRVSVYYIFIF